MGIFQRGNNFFIRYDDATGHQRQEKVGPSRKQAEALYRQRMVERTEIKKLGGPAKSYKEVTLKGFSERYLEYSRINKKPKMYRSEIRALKHLNEFFKNRFLSQINAGDIEDYKSHRLQQKVTNATINRELACLRTVFNCAVEWDTIRENPIRKIRLLREPPGRVRYLTEDELSRLLKECATHILPIVKIAINTGMRKGEILGLKWKDVDLDAGLIHIEETLSGKERNTPKAGKRRDVPINEEVKEIFESLPRNTDEIFISYGDPRKAFENACRRANIVNFKFHDLRHTAATYMVMDGTGLGEVMEILGLHSYGMVLRYAHFIPNLKKTAIERLGRRYKDLLNKPAPE